MATPSSFHKYLSMRQTAALLGISYTAFRQSFMRGHFPFKLVKVTAFRYKLRRDEVEQYILSLEPEKLVTLKEGESVAAVRAER